MTTKNLLLQICGPAAALLILSGLGMYWPSWAEAAPGVTAAPLVVIGDAVTYQGYLTNDKGTPLSGTFSMRFQIYNAPTGGDLQWTSNPVDIAVHNGLFKARLGTTTDIFNGEELWLAQTVNNELLTPRQEILPTPMAHTLRPGAIVKGTANALPNNYLLDVQMNNDAFAFNRGAITGQSTTGNAIYGLAENGRAIYGQTADGYAVYGFDGGSTANRGYAGYFYSTNGVGVYGYSGGNRSHPNIFAPGVYGQSNNGVGVYGRGDTSNSNSFYNEGGRFEGGSGIYARGTDSDGYGGEFYSNYRGIYARGATGSFDAYFGGDTGISTASVTTRGASTQALVVNAGSTAIAPGDLVAMAGVTESPEDGQPMLAVAKLDAGNRSAVIGVAKAAVAAEMIPHENHESIEFAPVSGDIEPDSYLVIVTNGLAPAVNLSSLNVLNEGGGESPQAIGASSVLTIGTKMAFSVTGEATTVGIGKVAGPIDAANGTIPMFIKID